MVAPTGAGPCPQITSTFPLRTSCTITGTSPPGPLRCGSTTCSVNAVATEASKALPPFSNVAMPTAVAIQWVEVTTPNVPSISGRVVNGLGFILGTIAEFPVARANDIGAVGLTLTQMAGDQLPRLHFAQERRFRPAALDRIGAAGVEVAARRPPAPPAAVTRCKGARPS